MFVLEKILSSLHDFISDVFDELFEFWEIREVSCPGCVDGVDEGRWLLEESIEFLELFVDFWDRLYNFSNSS